MSYAIARTRREEAPEAEAQTKDPGDTLMPCASCAAATPRKTLSMFGARCHACYAHYCRTSMPEKRQAPDFQGLRAWAKRLQWREGQGDGLSAAQRSMWREVLRDELRAQEVE